MSAFSRQRRAPAVWLICFLVVLPAGVDSGWTEEAPTIWHPPPPEPDEFDWVQLTSGEWLKGEIIAMYKKTLEFDSDKLKLQTLKWKDVKQLRSGGTMQVGMEDGSVAIGRIFVDQDRIRCTADEVKELPRSQIVTITAGAPKEINYWSAKVSLGANFRSGNTEQVETTGQANLIRRTTKNRIRLDYLAAFNQTDGVTAADSQRATSGWNRYYSKKLFWTPLYGEWYRDPFQNIASRWTVGTGLGFELIDSGEITWEITGGFAYQETRYDSVGEGNATSADTPAFVAGTSYEHELTDWMDLAFDYSFMFVNEESGTYTHHLTTGLEFELTRILDLDISLIWDRIQDPQEDEGGLIPEQDDYRLVFFLGFEF